VEGEHIVDRVVREYTITYSRRSRDNTTVGYASAKGKTLEDREVDAEIFATVIEILTGTRPRVDRRKNLIYIICTRGHLNGFARHAEFAGTIANWLNKTFRRRQTL